ncbi:bifunctional biotin--[acetyl-CoA-carboxylase] ligase/biotin operon repressor BirA [Marinibactrum halimedae]|nr:bifunctional biotin--[acetyl-CoA-carboxylase] ligase/biotin operon repressor BirA [Marinibactrum halimedae]MCD9461292.1 bifunctional biotin--[acetyl-CoA-carboxylase] ligase/biotin operon repressor BirA [Marinibactrum halimedae]
MKLLKRLSDGKWYSGEKLGEASGVSRTAIWKKLKKLEAFGLEVESSRGRGYRLAIPVDLLDKEVIAHEAGFPESNLYLFPQIDSTNQWLLDQIKTGLNNPVVCMAEYQSSGRGRRGRTWVSPFGVNLYFSLSYLFKGGISSLSGLSLAVGVVVSEVLESYGYMDIKLKWPNDLFWQDKKLSGVLIEVAGDLTEHCWVVVGIGLNINMGACTASSDINQPWSDLNMLSNHFGVDQPTRNELLSQLISALFVLLENFEKNKFGSYRERWMKRDYFDSLKVEAYEGGKKITGSARGVDSHGHLLIESKGVIKSFGGSDVSLRGGSE